MEKIPSSSLREACSVELPHREIHLPEALRPRLMPHQMASKESLADHNMEITSQSLRDVRKEQIQMETKPTPAPA